MKKIKEITLFTVGDANKLSTWSNVPYFFYKSLMAKDIRVNLVDINFDKELEKKWDKWKGRILNKLYTRSTYNYFRSNANFIDVQNRIKKAIALYPNSDANIFLTFSFSSAGMSKKPTVLFSDWTYEHHFKQHLKREPNFFEKQCIARENAQIEKADLLLPLFPKVAEYMLNRYKNKKIKYLGNVINSVYNVSEEGAINAKENSFDLLFVGSEVYKAGATALISAFVNLKKAFPQLKLHIVGMNKVDFENLPNDVFCYGYLDKGNDDQREIYYNLFKKAKVFINTTPNWGGFSATIEAMYFYIPLVVSPYEEFVKTFGKQINFGNYCQENSPEQIEKNIKSILNNSGYNTLGINAHNAVKDYTWNVYIDKVIDEVEKVS
jgi:glycosyltransferase involved in cell wall biosynthesis